MTFNQVVRGSNPRSLMKKAPKLNVPELFHFCRISSFVMAAAVIESDMRLRKMEKEIRKIFIGGKSGAGKSFLVSRLIDDIKKSGMEVGGYCTKQYRDREDEDGEYLIYIYPAGAGERRDTEENFVGTCRLGRRKIRTEVFEKYGMDLLNNMSEGAIAVFDEVGFFEADVPAFTEKVLEILNSERCCITVVKEKYGVPYIDAVRALGGKEGAVFVTVTEENREELYLQLAEIIQNW